jgi:hypothetical protein
MPINGWETWHQVWWTARSWSKEEWLPIVIKWSRCPMLMHLLTRKHNRVTGVIVRDELGHVIDVMSRWYDVLPNLISGEAYACWNGIDLICSMNMLKVIMETGSLKLALLWKSSRCIKFRSQVEHVLVLMYVM